MALFKIYNNAGTSNALPNTYNPGYCYFDVRTNKFWIDTSSTAAGRLPINALRANVSDLASSLIFGTCSSAANAATKIVVIDKVVDSTNDIVINGYPFPVLKSGLTFAVYFENGNTNSAPSITFQLNDGTQTLPVGEIYCNGTTPASNDPAHSWVAGSLIIFTVMVSPSLGNKCVMLNWNDTSNSGGAQVILKTWEASSFIPDVNI